MNRWSLTLFALLLPAQAFSVEIRPLPQTAVEARIMKALTAPFDFKCESKSLATVLGEIGEKAKIPLVLKAGELEAMGLDPNLKMTRSVVGGTLEACLEGICAEVEDICFVVTPKALIVTTVDDAETQETIRVYDLQKLVDSASPAPDETNDVQAVARLVRNFTFPPGEEEATKPSADSGPVLGSSKPDVFYVSNALLGGARKLSPRVEVFGHLLIVKAGKSTHEEVQSLLSQLYTGLRPDEVNAENP